MSKAKILMSLGAVAMLFAFYTASAAAEFKGTEGKGHLLAFDMEGGGGEISCEESTELENPVTWTAKGAILKIKMESIAECEAVKGEKEEKAAINACELEVKEPGGQMKVEGALVGACKIKEGSSCETLLESTKTPTELAYTGEANKELQVEPAALSGVTSTKGTCLVESSKQEKVSAVADMESLAAGALVPSFFLFREGGPERIRTTSEVRKVTLGNSGTRGRFNFFEAFQTRAGAWAKIAKKTVGECKAIGEYEMGESCAMEVQALMLPTAREAALGLRFEVISVPNGAPSRVFLNIHGRV